MGKKAEIKQARDKREKERRERVRADFQRGITTIAELEGLDRDKAAGSIYQPFRDIDWARVNDMIARHVEMGRAVERQRIDENMRAHQETVRLNREMWQEDRRILHQRMDRISGNLDALRLQLQKLLDPAPIVRECAEAFGAYEVIEALTERQIARFTSPAGEDGAKQQAETWVAGRALRQMALRQMGEDLAKRMPADNKEPY